MEVMREEWRSFAALNVRERERSAIEFRPLIKRIISEVQNQRGKWPELCCVGEGIQMTQQPLSDSHNHRARSGGKEIRPNERGFL